MGIAKALLAAVRVNAGTRRLRLFDHPGNYLSPGVDVRYVAARAFLEKRGFRALAEVENIRAPGLDCARPLVGAIEREPPQRLPRAPRLSRSAAPPRAVAERLLANSSRQRSRRCGRTRWQRALDGPRRAVHAAWLDGAPVAFAAADGNNRGLGWFGPAGTAPAHRGKGLGEALLLPCLLDVRGLPEAGVIAWIGPKAFYAKTVGAVDDRRFVTLGESSRDDRRALILAAGFGTRLGTLSDERPKPLLPVCDIPLIRYAVALLAGHGVRELAINLHHRGELIETEIGSGAVSASRSSIARSRPSSGTGGRHPQNRRLLPHARRRDSFFRGERQDLDRRRSDRRARAPSRDRRQRDHGRARDA